MSDSSSTFQVQVPSDPTKMDKSSISDVLPMTDRTDRVMTERATSAADQQVFEATRNKMYLGNVVTYDAIPYFNAANTDAAGTAKFYLTDDGTPTGKALFSSIDQKTVVAMPYGPTSNYQVTSVTISSDMKTVTVGVNQLGSVVLGAITVTTAAAGIPVNLSLFGKV